MVEVRFFFRERERERKKDERERERERQRRLCVVSWLADDDDSLDENRSTSFSPSLDSI